MKKPSVHTPEQVRKSMEIIETISRMRQYTAEMNQRNVKIGFVPTMGAFHEGHLSLMRQCKKDCDAALVSIFVNPLQFSLGEDYDRYPRQLPLDIQMAEAEEMDALFVPTVAEMYLKGYNTFVDQGEDGLSTKLCGSFRPGHFRGVMSVVCKLFNIVRPDVAYFGQKDYQQYLLIRRTVTDLNLNVQIRLMPTVRDEDGLALSSRNTYLGPKQKRDALCLYRALKKAEEVNAMGESSAAKVIRQMENIIKRVKGAKIDYVTVVNAETLEPVKEIKGKTLVALAVRIGKARLIDNILL